MVNEYAVLERKVTMARSYLLDSETFQAGEVYEIQGDPGSYFKIDYMNGVFAWGFRLGSPQNEEALPISMLKNKGTNKQHEVCCLFDIYIRFTFKQISKASGYSSRSLEACIRSCGCVLIVPFARFEAYSAFARGSPSNLV